MGLEGQIEQIARDAHEAARTVASLSTNQKNAWLARCAERLEAAKPAILEANQQDIREAGEKGLAAPMLRRLELAGRKWDSMIDGLRQVATLPDPVGEISQMRVRPNGIRVGRMRIPLGVIAMVYESRPEVTVDAAALCLKAGNAVILRGGSESFHANQALGAEIRGALADGDIPEAAVSLIPTTDRAAIDHFLKLDEYIDLVIPRGGKGLVRKVKRDSTIPVIAHDEGVCHVFLDASAEVEMATEIVLDSKLRQMAVCNGLETLLCHEEAVQRVLPTVLKALHEEGVEVRGCERTCQVFSEAVAAADADWREEYLDKIVAVRVVADLDEAIRHIQVYGSEHTDMIVTNDYANGQEWLRRVNSSTVGINCSTAFSDGYRLGLGAEIGISTSKLHSFGPMGLEELTTRKWVLYGDGQLGA